MWPPFLVKSLKTLNLDELNKVIQQINRAFIDINRGVIYASKGDPQVASQNIPEYTIERHHLIERYILSTVVLSGLSPYSGFITSSFQLTSGIIQDYHLSSGVISSGCYLGSGVVGSANLDNFYSLSSYRVHADSFGFSGWLYQALSTGLSSITCATVAPTSVSGINPAWDANLSGLAQLATVIFSGHCLDVEKHYVTSGGITSAGTSSQIHFIVVGQ